MRKMCEEEGEGRRGGDQKEELVDVRERKKVKKIQLLHIEYFESYLTNSYSNY